MTSKTSFTGVPTLLRFGDCDLRSMKDTSIVILDDVEDCPYLDGESARMPLRMPLLKLEPEEIDKLLYDGNRRTGEFIYKTECAACQACGGVPPRYHVLRCGPGLRAHGVVRCFLPRRARPLGIPGHRRRALPPCGIPPRGCARHGVLPH